MTTNRLARCSAAARTLLPWLFAAALLWFAALPPAAFAQLRPIEHLIPTATLQAQVARRFPFVQPVAGDLVTLELRNPRFTMLPAANRIGTTLELKLTSPLLGAAAVPGSIALDWRPRLEPRDRTIRMTDVEVRSIRLDGVPEEYRRWLDRNAPRLAGNPLDDQVLYTLTGRDLAALAAFGWQLGAFNVVAEGLRVRLDPLKR